ncbi:Protein ELYS [Balamuthia mandrillaris]
MSLEIEPTSVARYQLRPPIVKEDVETGLSFGGISRDGSFSWIAFDDVLVVFEAHSSHERKAIWSFQTPMSKPMQVLCVAELCLGSPGSVSMLVASVQHPKTRLQQLRFLDVDTGTTICVMDVPHAVTAILSLADAEAQPEKSSFGGALSKFGCPCVIGTCGGYLYALDIQSIWNKKNKTITMTQEITIADMETYSPDSFSAASYDIPCLNIDKRYHERNCLILPQEEWTRSGPTKLESLSLPGKGVFVSALHYIPQMRAMAVGYNFGCWQLWSPASLELLYTSFYQERKRSSSLAERAPITHFVFQDLPNHPGHGYIWAASGTLPSILTPTAYSATVTIFTLKFQLTVHNGEGPKAAVIPEIRTVQADYEKSLGLPSEQQRGRAPCNARVVGILPFHPREKVQEEEKSRLLDDMDEEEEKAKEASNKHVEEESNVGCPHVVFVWEVYPPGTTSIIPALMPPQKRTFQMELFNLELVVWGNTLASGQPFIPFTLSFLQDKELLAVWLDPSSMSMFELPMNVLSDDLFEDSDYEDLFPISFDAYCLSEDAISCLSFLGDQQRALALLSEKGPSLLSDFGPTEALTSLYQECKLAGLMPPNPTEDENAEVDPVYQQHQIFHVCLRHNLISTLCHLVSQRNGLTYSLSNPKIVLDWAWQTFLKLKTLLSDNQTGIYRLFWDNTFRHPRHLAQNKAKLTEELDTILARLGDIYNVFQALLTRFDTTEEGFNALNQKLTAILLVLQHLEVVLWFYSKGLLPSTPIVYPRDVIVKNYERRKRERADRFNATLSTISATVGKEALGRDATNVPPLFIEDLLDSCLVPNKAKQLLVGEKTAEESAQTQQGGLWQLLSIFSELDQPRGEGEAESELNVRKHRIILYFLIELTGMEAVPPPLLDDYIMTFMLPASLQQLTCGFWMLDDNCSLEMACSHLTDPSLKLDTWDLKILQSLFDAGSYQQALKFLRCVQPTPTSLKDAAIYILTLLHSNLFHEAFWFQRSHSDVPQTRQALMYFLLSYCNETRSMRQLLKLPLDDVEEQCMMNFLTFSHEELRIIYLLQRSRYVEAIRAFEQLEVSSVVTDYDQTEGEGSFNRTTNQHAKLETLRALIENYKLITPAIQLSAADSFQIRVGLDERSAGSAPTATRVSMMMEEPATPSFPVSQASRYAQQREGLLFENSQPRRRTPSKGGTASLFSSSGSSTPFARSRAHQYLVSQAALLNSDEAPFVGPPSSVTKKRAAPPLSQRGDTLQSPTAARDTTATLVGSPFSGGRMSYPQPKFGFEVKPTENSSSGSNISRRRLSFGKEDSSLLSSPSSNSPASSSIFPSYSVSRPVVPSGLTSPLSSSSSLRPFPTQSASSPSGPQLPFSPYLSSPIAKSIASLTGASKPSVSSSLAISNSNRHGPQPAVPPSPLSLHQPSSSTSSSLQKRTPFKGIIRRRHTSHLKTPPMHRGAVKRVSFAPSDDMSPSSSPSPIREAEEGISSPLRRSFPTLMQEEFEEAAQSHNENFKSSSATTTSNSGPRRSFLLQQQLLNEDETASAQLQEDRGSDSREDSDAADAGDEDSEHRMTDQDDNDSDGGGRRPRNRFSFGFSSEMDVVRQQENDGTTIEEEKQNNDDDDKDQNNELRKLSNGVMEPNNEQQDDDDDIEHDVNDEQYSLNEEEQVETVQLTRRTTRSQAAVVEAASAIKGRTTPMRTARSKLLSATPSSSSSSIPTSSATRRTSSVSTTATTTTITPRSATKKRLAKRTARRSTSSSSANNNQ